MSNVLDKLDNDRIHIVILGAGASKAAFPNGDRNGKLVPLMNEISSITSIRKFLHKEGLSNDIDSFEEFYSELLSDPDKKVIVSQLEHLIYDYFSELELPDNPTIYDYILLSLRENDVIATFNWDPFIVQSYLRVKKITKNIPQVFFLHGTVALGECKQHSIVDLIDRQCPQCKKPLERIKLLYPTTSKDYTQDAYIKDQWDAIVFYLGKANGMTIFGYAAPKTDVAAIDLLKQGWGDNNKRIMEEIDIINIDHPEALQKSWNQFIHETHFSIFKDYFESSLSLFPRRISEYQYSRFNLNMWLDNHQIEKGLDFSQLEQRIKYLIDFESS